MLMGGRAAEELTCDSGGLLPGHSTMPQRATRLGAAWHTLSSKLQGSRKAAADTSGGPRRIKRRMPCAPTRPCNFSVPLLASPLAPAVSTGAVDDIRRATDMAYKAVSGAQLVHLPAGCAFPCA